MVVTLGQQYNVGKKPTVILYAYINRQAGPPNQTKQGLDAFRFFFKNKRQRSAPYIVKKVVINTITSP